MSAVDIVLERETANDESALVVRVLVASGDAVDADQLLFEIENSKATQELRAPAAGFVTHALAVGQTVDFGVPIAKVGAEKEWASPTKSSVAAPGPAANGGGAHAHPASNGHAASRKVITTVPNATTRRLFEPRFSEAARSLALENGLEASAFDVDFVTTKDVYAWMGVAVAPVPRAAAAPAVQAPAAAVSAPGSSPGSASRPAAPGPKLGQAISQRKRAEIDALTRGAGESMLSVLGVTLGAIKIEREPGDFLAGSITDLVIYEASRLMRKYPKLNAYFADGQLVEHEPVHAGLAIDSGGRLVVYGIEHTDKLGLRELADAMSDAVGRYMENALTSSEMSRATFTVTDLSADELDFVLPLLPWGQCVILGITRSASSGFRIFAGFDHRVTEGREVAQFLGELKERLLSFVASQPAAVVESHCGYCDRSASEATAKGRDKGLLKVVGRDGREILCCASCWNGW